MSQVQISAFQEHLSRQPYAVRGTEYSDGQLLGCVVSVDIGNLCLSLHMLGPVHVLALGDLIAQAGRDLEAARAARKNLVPNSFIERLSEVPA